MFVYTPDVRIREATVRGTRLRHRTSRSTQHGRNRVKVTAFNGSPRTDGNTAHLIRHVFNALEQEGIETELFQLGGRPIRGCAACYGCFKNKDG
ncbi:MAG: flavodoxin family protein, partial [Hyphomicrobiaceae bacterium]|nr:flavodoxin family protein [Hyphomicrobiaceae bacterium]